MDHDEIRLLYEHSTAWRLLRARNAPLVLALLGRVFVDDNTGPVPAGRLLGELEDLLAALDVPAEGTDAERTQLYSGSAASYLDDWSSPQTAWLRRFYPPGSDEVHYDATPAVERSVAWVRSLGPRPFVGTESWLDSLVQLLRQMVHGSEHRPQVRLAELRRRRDALDREIAEVEQAEAEGRPVEVMDDVALRERYHLFTATARDLLADFREVEENFRTLDRAARERIATWEGGKGALLEHLVGDRGHIDASDQGRSFAAFYEFLLSDGRQREVAELLEAVQRLDGISADPRVRTVHHEWSDAAARTQQTVRQLSEQLRRFLDDRVWLENRRVLELARAVEAHALALRDRPPPIGLTIDLPGLDIALPFDRPLYDPRPRTVVDSRVEPGDVDDLDASSLFEQHYIDSARLAANIRSVVPERGTARLEDVLGLFPAADGLAEIVGYLALSEDDLRVDIDPLASERVVLAYTGADGVERGVRTAPVTVSRVTAARRESRA